METDSLFVCTEGKKLWIKDFHLILLRKRFKKLDKYSYAIDFCKEVGCTDLLFAISLTSCSTPSKVDCLNNIRIQ